MDLQQGLINSREFLGLSAPPVSAAEEAGRILEREMRMRRQPRAPRWTLTLRQSSHASLRPPPLRRLELLRPQRPRSQVSTHEDELCHGFTAEPHGFTAEPGQCGPGSRACHSVASTAACGSASKPPCPLAGESLISSDTQLAGLSLFSSQAASDSLSINESD